MSPIARRKAITRRFCAAKHHQIWLAPLAIRCEPPFTCTCHHQIWLAPLAIRCEPPATLLTRRGYLPQRKPPCGAERSGRAFPSTLPSRTAASSGPCYTTPLCSESRRFPAESAFDSWRRPGWPCVGGSTSVHSRTTRLRCDHRVVRSLPGCGEAFRRREAPACNAERIAIAIVHLTRPRPPLTSTAGRARAGLADFGRQRAHEPTAFRRWWSQFMSSRCAASAACARSRPPRWALRASARGCADPFRAKTA
jgi:hypothetical protein